VSQQCRLHYVFTVVSDAKDCRKLSYKVLGFMKRGDVDKPYTVWIRLCYFRAKFERKTRLADASATRNRNKCIRFVQAP
jgi:hypothetical protein